MRRSSTLVALPIIAAAVACTPPVNTVPMAVSPTASVQYYDLEIPADLEIRNVDFSATAFTDVSGMNGITATTVTGRAFVKVYAVQKRTGEQFLLLYEDIMRRKQPIQVIRFRPAPAVLPGG